LTQSGPNSKCTFALIKTRLETTRRPNGHSNVMDEKKRHIGRGLSRARQAEKAKRGGKRMDLEEGTWSRGPRKMTTKGETNSIQKKKSPSKKKLSRREAGTRSGTGKYEEKSRDPNWVQGFTKHLDF